MLVRIVDYYDVLGNEEEGHEVNGIAVFGEYNVRKDFDGFNLLKKVGFFLISFAIIMPIFNASFSIFLSYIFELSKGDAFLLALLSGSASYIAVPAAMRLSVPQANPGLYLPLSLAITFPFNISLGIPLYYFIINLVWG